MSKQATGGSTRPKEMNYVGGHDIPVRDPRDRNVERASN
jgi:hypothetical protein